MHLFLSAFEKIGEIDCPLTVDSVFPSIATMPLDIAAKIEEKTKATGFVKYRKQRRDKYLRLFKRGYEITEILYLPHCDSNENIPLPLGDLFCGKELYYSIGDLKAHLQNVLKELKNNNKYRVILKKERLKNACLYVMDGVGAIVYSNLFPSVVFSFTQRFMADAFCEYLKREVGVATSREQMIRDLEEYILNI